MDCRSAATPKTASATLSRATTRSTGTDNGIRIKSTSSTGGVVSNISYSNDTLNNIRQYAIIFDAVYPSVARTAVHFVHCHQAGVHNIHLTNIKMNNCAQAGYFLGLPNQPITDVTIQLLGTASKPFELADAGTSSQPIDFTGSTFTVNGSTSNRVKLYRRHLQRDSDIE